MQKKRILHLVEEVILLVLILLNIFDFFEVLPPDLDYVKKVISWTALGYLLYKASLSYIFFNNRHRHLDIALIIAYFMLIFKNIVAFSQSVHEKFILFHDFQIFVLKYASALELYFLMGGSILLLSLAVYSAFKISVKKPSIMEMLHEHGMAKTARSFLLRVLLTYFVFLAFFVVVFNLIMEWLAIAIDAPLIMVGILGYIYLVMHRYKRYSVENLIYKVGEFGERFYERFISLFHKKKTLLLGVSGMVVLHLVTDALAFIVPYLIVFRDSLYFSQLGPGHNSLLSLFMAQISSANAIPILALYVLNAVGALLLLLLPAVFWYLAFSKKSMKVGNASVAVAATSILAFFVSPVFSFSRLQSSSFIGVDIQTQFVEPIGTFWITALIYILSFFIFYTLSKFFKHASLLATMGTSIGFFVYYIYLFSTSQFLYYLSTIQSVFVISGKGICAVILETVLGCRALITSLPWLESVFKLFSYALSVHFVLFFLITVLFYLAGSIMFIDEFIKEKVYKKIK